MTEPAAGKSELPPTLDYEAPPKPLAARNVASGIFSFIAAIIAVPSFFLGVAWLTYAIFKARYGRSADLVKAGVFIGIGFVCVIASWRWNRASVQGPKLEGD